MEYILYVLVQAQDMKPVEPTLVFERQIRSESSLNHGDSCQSIIFRDCPNSTVCEIIEIIDIIRVDVWLKSCCK